MDLFKSNVKTQHVFAAVVDGNTLFLDFHFIRDEYAGVLVGGNRVSDEITGCSFSLGEQNKACLFENLSSFTNVLSYDLKHKNLLKTLLEKNNISFENLKMQRISGENVTITPFNLKEFIEFEGVI